MSQIVSYSNTYIPRVKHGTSPQKSSLGIAPLWQKASAEPPIIWEKWNQQLYLGIVAKDGNKFQKLLQDPPPVRKPQDPGYELWIEEETQGRPEIEASAIKKKEYNGKIIVVKLIIWDPCEDVDSKFRSYI